MFKGLVRLHDLHDLTVDYGTALLLDALLQRIIRDILFFCSLPFWNQVDAQSLTFKFHVQGKSLSITIESLLVNFFQQNFNTWLAKSN
jgi:hypothetical protein